MSLAVPSIMLEATPFGDMSPAIVAMLRDEANLSAARQVLMEARADAHHQLNVARSQRPAFGIIGSKKQREDYASSVSSLETQLVAIDAILSRVNDARERLQPGLRAALADFLNHTDPTYRRGFRASRYHEHWRRAHALVCDRFRAFVRDLREARNSIAKDAQRERPRYSNDSLWHLTNLKKAALELDREIEALNHVCHEFTTAVADSPFAALSLPAMQILGCSQIADTLTLRATAVGLTETESLLAEFVDVRQPELQTLTETFDVLASEHAQLAEARLRQYWSGLLMHAETHLVSDADLEPTLADIELRQAETERMRVSGQAVRPFENER